MKFEVDKQERVVVVTSKVEKLDALCAPELKGELVLANKEGTATWCLTSPKRDTLTPVV